MRGEASPAGKMEEGAWVGEEGVRMGGEWLSFPPSPPQLPAEWGAKGRIGSPPSHLPRLKLEPCQLGRPFPPRLLCSGGAHRCGGC